jgi:hypothetical protein
MSHNDKYLIRSHQHNAWWKPGGWGYTTSLFEAGRFSEDTASDLLRWDQFREWQADGKPNEVIILAPTDEQMRDVNVLLLIRDRVTQATDKAMADRAGGAA